MLGGNPRSCGLNTFGEHLIRDGYHITGVLVARIIIRQPYLTAISEANKVLMNVPRVGKKKDKLKIAMCGSPLRKVCPIKTTLVFIPKFTIVL